MIANSKIVDDTFNNYDNWHEEAFRIYEGKCKCGAKIESRNETVECMFCFNLVQLTLKEYYKHTGNK